MSRPDALSRELRNPELSMKSTILFLMLLTKKIWVIIRKMNLSRNQISFTSYNQSSGHQLGISSLAQPRYMCEKTQIQRQDWGT